MAIEQDRKNFAAEFEALKAKYGEAFSDLKAVRFYGEADEKIRTERIFTPYWCRQDDLGFIHCEKERPE
ncbi:MAG TPA: hypothetical protein VGG03_19405 [Thermoanaerobaculia bacterium]